MQVKNTIKNTLRKLTSNNSLSEARRIARDFRKFGNDKQYSDWSQLIMQEEDKYTGYLYAAINNRAKKTAMLGESHLITTAKNELAKKAKDNEEELTHPYLDLINESKTFTNYEFWYTISTYLDLKGCFYLMALRNQRGDLTGKIQEFKILNPYNVKRVTDNEGNLIGYVEGKDGQTREIPTHMIIPMKALNPFSDKDPYSMSDAARDPQFTLKTASDHTRHSVQKNRGTQGIVVVDDETIALDPQKQENFRARVTGKQKGEPIFGFGKGSIAYNDMQIDLNKSALDKVNEVNLKQLVAVTGNSKTVFGIEESGVTRDTSLTMTDNFINDHAVPQMKLIIGALNQDFKNNYTGEYEKTKYTLDVNSPSSDEQDRQVKEQDIKQKRFDLYVKMRRIGYDHETASLYASGKAEITEIEDIEMPSLIAEPEPEPEPTEENHIHSDFEESITNLFEENEQGVITQQQGTLETSVKNVERQLIANVVKKVSKNQYDEQSDIINKSDRKEAETELKQSLEAFYLVIIPLFAKRVLSRRSKEFAMSAIYDSKGVGKYARDIAAKSSASHVNTVLEDVRQAVQKKALEGASQRELVNLVTSEYNNIAQHRAKAIARTETNRAFTQSQFQADKMFLRQNDLMGRAYKKWITRSDNPCPLCLEMASRPPTPFNEDFLEFGSELVVSYEENDKTKVRKQSIDYEPLEAGNLHTNCSCSYQLIVE